MFDLHLHSNYSDGDVAVEDIVAEAARRGLTGLSITDHNGVWGLAEGAAAAARYGLGWLEGIEISARIADVDVHVLGYSRAFRRERLAEGLAETRRGYEARMQAMIAKCHTAGFNRISWEGICSRRSKMKDPVYLSYDLRRALQGEYGLSFSEVRTLTTRGGACHVPYGAWALSPAEAVALIHGAGGVASLAHARTVIQDGSQSLLEQLLKELLAAGVDGIEIYHPFHTPALVKELQDYCVRHTLLVTGGSDWHGPEQFADSHAQFGSIGISSAELEKLLERI